MTTPPGIDPRGPRFAAAITSVLLLIATLLGLLTASGARLAAVLVAVLVALLFLWGVLSPQTHPWAVLFRSVIRPRLVPPAELEDPRPPRFAQGVGLFVVGVGLLLHLAGVPAALPIATAAAFAAAFLNAAFGYCLGCQIYLLLRRAGVLRSAA
ncbi:MULTISPECIES: DUF4395 domain-containing protein [Microbacterium]|uniref:DUF4395 domain-containing protein n=1 Tax=Microbacterium TaxID=33882 RepID=UPI00217E8B86|nr:MULTISPECIES: DUF4395 domain-containing protein [Microbacterium]UWF78346.1 DUF4395 family protein [Microbacterium neungamense]WCM56523.1 DUF4395 family protein [Microbacterium sp. EF45047]